MDIVSFFVVAILNLLKFLKYSNNFPCEKFHRSIVKESWKNLNLKLEISCQTK